MQKFIKNITLWTFILSITLSVYPIYLLYNNKYLENILGIETYISLAKSEQKSNAKTLLIGDSVGKQLFDNNTDNDTINSLACNYAVGMLGQYIFIKNYIDAGNKIDSLILIASPFSFGENLNNKFTYHYFLKPFYTSKYKPLFSEYAIRQVKKIPFYQIAQIPHIYTSNWAPNFRSKDTVDYSFLSPISVDYLKRINDLAIANNFTFTIIPAMVKASRRNEVDDIDFSEIRSSGLEPLFDNYQNHILFLDDTCFVDHIHLNKKTLATFTNIPLKTRLNAIHN